MRTPVALMLITGAIFRGSSSIQWSGGLQKDAVLYACAGESLSFPWRVSLTTGESIVAVQWFYEGRSQEKIAMLSHGSFSPLPAFSGRVELTTNEGLVLHHVTVLDSGNYSVEFTAQRPNGELITARRTAVVYIRDGLLTRDAKLQVRMSTEAKFDDSMQLWRIVLTCGTFVHTSRPAFNVTWSTPSGVPKPSSSYEDGEFLLLLTPPVDAGPYECRVPAHPQSICGSRLPEEGRVVVDRTEARLAVLESQQQAQLAVNEKLKEQNELLTQNVMSGSAGRVSFHVRLYTSVHLPTWTKLVMTDVISNHGNAYSNVTGEFVAPYNATYFFIASTSVYGTNHVANFFLMETRKCTTSAPVYSLITGNACQFAPCVQVDDKEVDYAYTNSGAGHSEGGAVHAVVTLAQGQKVWLRSYQDSYYLDGPTAFSGFLIYHNFT